MDRLTALPDAVDAVDALGRRRGVQASAMTAWPTRAASFTELPVRRGCASILR
jgi:hypothetical protein